MTALVSFYNKYKKAVRGQAVAILGWLSAVLPGANGHVTTTQWLALATLLLTGPAVATTTNVTPLVPAFPAVPPSAPLPPVLEG